MKFAVTVNCDTQQNDKEVSGFSFASLIRNPPYGYYYQETTVGSGDPTARRKDVVRNG